MASLWKTFRSGSSKIDIYEVLEWGGDQHRYGFAAVKNNGSFTKIRSAYSGEFISTRTIKGETVLVPIYNPQSKVWKFYKWTEWAYHIEPKIMGKKVGSGYVNVRGQRWRQQR